MPRASFVTGRPELIPGLLGVGLLIAWAVADGGSPPTSLYPGALFAAGLATVVAIAYRREIRLGTANVVAIAGLGAFCVWSFASIAYAPSPADAWEAANRTLAYLAVLIVFLVPAWRQASAAAVLGAFSVGAAAVALGTLIGVAGADEGSLDFIDGRLAEPTGYQNATAAVFVIAAWPALFLASRREVPAFLRPLLLASAGVLIELAVLPQSRGVAIAAAVGAIVYLALVPNRPRALLAALPVAVVVALAGPTLIDVLDAMRAGGEPAAAAADDALRAVLISLFALIAAGAILAGADAAVTPSERASRLARKATGAGLAAAAAFALVAALVAIGNPFSWAEERWDDFRAGYGEQELTAANRFTSGLGSNRYDFWRVAVHEFGERPLQGAGAGGYETLYLEERESLDEPRFAHSLPLEVAAEGGLIGLLTLGAALGGLLAAAIATRLRAAGEPARGIGAVALVAFATWAVAAAVDWIWQVPAVTAPVLAILALAGRMTATAEDGEPAAPGRARLLAVAAGVLAALAIVSFTGPWLAALRTDDAAESWQGDPARALELLDQARSLNPLTADADLLAGAIAVRTGESEAALARYEGAVEREPRNWYALLQLAVVQAGADERQEALASLDAAAAANPREPLIATTRQQIERGRMPSAEEIDAELLGRVCTRVGRTGATRYCE